MCLDIIQAHDAYFFWEKISFESIYRLPREEVKEDDKIIMFEEDDGSFSTGTE